MSKTKVLILGIGNLLWADEGFGVRAVEALNQYYILPDNVSLMDGGTQGLYLVPHIQEANVLVIFDAIDYGLPPGTLKVVLDEDVPKFMGVKKMSLHQTGFQEVLSMAELLGNYPKHILLVGVQPEELEDYGGSLTPKVKAQILPAIKLAIGFLLEQGIEAEERPISLSNEQRLSDECLTIEQYENQRPSADEACRVGDDRVLKSKSIQYNPALDSSGSPVNSESGEKN